MTNENTIYSDPGGMTLIVRTINSPMVLRLEQYDMGLFGGISDTIAIRVPLFATLLAEEIDAWVGGQLFEIRQGSHRPWTSLGQDVFSIKTSSEHVCIPDKIGAKKISKHLKTWAGKWDTGNG